MFKVTVLFLFPLLALAQLTPDSVTVTATRDLTPQPDQIVFGVILNAGTDAGLDEALAAVAGAGLTIRNFAGVNYSSSPGFGVPVQWQFSLTAPIGDMKKTVGLLSAMQRSLANEKKFSLFFTVNGLQVSAQLRQQQTCPLGDLVSDARKQASDLASGAGTTVGAVQALSSATLAGAPGPCSVTAKFALGAVGQADPETVTITAAPAPALQTPDRISGNVDVSADPGMGLDEITRVLTPLGITAADLLSVSQFTARPCAPPATGACSAVDWYFRYTAPIAKLKESLAALDGVRNAKHPGITVAYNIGASVSSTPACAIPTLISQARTQAESVAAAAGVHVGALAALSDGNGVPGLAIPSAVLRVGDFSQGFLGGTTYAPILTTAGPGCTAVAQFKLLR